MKSKVLSTLAALAMGLGLVLVTATASSATANIPCSANRTVGSGSLTRVIPTTSSGSSDCYLVQGNSGNGVRALQRALVYCEGYSVGSSGVDGSYGPATKSAVLSFQRGNGLTADGQYGNQTRNSIEFLSTNYNPSASEYYFCNRY